MSYIPQNLKYKKLFRAKLTRRIYKLSPVSFSGTIQLLITEAVFISSRQFKAIQFRLNKLLKKRGRGIIFFFPNKIKTVKKSARMGKGKGSEKTWYYCTKPGSLLCKIDCLSMDLGLKVALELKKRLPCNIKVIKNKF